MLVKIINYTHDLQTGRDAIHLIHDLSLSVNSLKQEVVRIGNDALTNAHKLREHGEWLRRNQGSSAAWLPAITMAAKGGVTPAAQMTPVAQAALSATLDPHKDSRKPPTISFMSPKLLPGLVHILNEADG